MTVLAIGFSWVNGEKSAPYPSSWIPTDGFDKDSVAVELFAGTAGEIFKLRDYDIGAHRSDLKDWQTLGCGSPPDDYIHQAIEILRKRDDGLARVHKRLMQERINPSNEPFVDSDSIKKQVHLTPEEFESLVANQ